MKDLLCWVPDADIQAVLQVILENRRESIQMRQVTFDIFRHKQRDPGLFATGVSLLSESQRNYHHVLIILDAAWEGAPRNLQQALDGKITQAGLQDWAQAVVIDPELEVWVWSQFRHVAEALGWKGGVKSMSLWLMQRGLLNPKDTKPKDPKKAAEEVLRYVGKPRSSSIYRELAKKVGLRNCTDKSFQRFAKTLREWFPLSSG